MIPPTPFQASALCPTPAMLTAYGPLFIKSFWGGIFRPRVVAKAGQVEEAVQRRLGGYKETGGDPSRPQVATCLELLNCEDI